jgi:D-glycero-D-manno-heptose 1,7-bisphosphate phosphatase
MAGIIFDAKPRDKRVPQKLLLLDLDGTVRMQRLNRYPEKVEQVEIFPGVPELLMSYSKLGWAIMAISNQGGIGKGEVTSEAVQACMMKTHELCGGVFDGMIWCPHHPKAENPDMAQCFCRKPKYGMFVQAQMMIQQVTGALFPQRLMKFVGDQPEDEEAATAAGITFQEAEKWRAEVLTMNLMNFPRPSKIIQ